MRILIATNNLSIIGGAETYQRSVIPELIKKGHEVAVLHERPKSSSKETILDFGPSIFCFSLFEKPIKECFDIAEKWSPDVVFYQGMTNLEISEILTKKWPSFLFAHSSFGTCIDGSKRWRKPLVEICDKAFGINCLFEYYPRGCGGLNPIKGIKNYIYTLKRYKLLKNFRKIFVASEWMRNDLENNGIDKTKIIVCPYFPTMCKPEPDSPEIKSFSNNLLFAGRITANKGWRHAVMAISEIQKRKKIKLNLTIAGDGPDLGKMRKLSNKLNVESTYLGWIDQHLIQKVMKKSDLLLMPSLWAEPFGLIGLEAGCVGLPTVGYLVGGIKDWLKPGVSGESGSEGEMNLIKFTEKIERILSDANYWQKLRVGAWSNSKKYAIETHLQVLDQGFISGIRDK